MMNGIYTSYTLCTKRKKPTTTPPITVNLNGCTILSGATKMHFFFWHNARIYMFCTLLERFLYVHGHLVLLQCKSASCLSSLYFSLASKWNQATNTLAV